MIPILFDAGIPQYFQQKSIKQLYRYLLVQSTKTFVYIMIDLLNYTPLCKNMLQITKSNARPDESVPESNLIRHFEKHEAWRTVKRKIIAFWGTTNSKVRQVQQMPGL